LAVIRVVCTGKGTHREKGCGHWFDFGQLGGGGTFRLGDDRRLVEVAREKEWDDWREGGKPLESSYVFSCRRCMRETRMKAGTLRTALDGLHAKGVETLDISQLPF
jgi:hypothetical protein